MHSNIAFNLAQTFYVGYYGRIGDPGGLVYWANEISENGGILEVRNAFGNSLEFKKKFGHMDNEALVNNLYRQMFGRDAEQEGLDFWVDLLENKQATLASITIEILNGARGKDAEVFANKLEAANYFTAALDTVDEVNVYKKAVYAYRDEGQGLLATQLLDSLTDEPETLARFKAIVDAAFGAPGTGESSDMTLADAIAAFPPGSVEAPANGDQNGGDQNGGDQSVGGQNGGADDGTLGGILDGVGDGLEDIVTDTGNTFGDQVGGVTGDVGGTVDDTVDGVGDVVDGVGDGVGGLLDSVLGDDEKDTAPAPESGNSSGDASDSQTESGTLGGILDDTGDVVEDVLGDTGNTFGDEVGGITGELGSTVDDTVDGVGNVVDGVGDGLGGLLDAVLGDDGLDTAPPADDQAAPDDQTVSNDSGGLLGGLLPLGISSDHDTGLL